MKQYWVEGVYIASGKKKTVQSGGREPFYESFWAESPDEALRMAAESIQSGKWVDGPRICKTSEEERMRKMGAPQLPFFNEPKGAKKTKK